MVCGLLALLLLAACRPDAPAFATPPLTAVVRTVSPDDLLEGIEWQSVGIPQTATPAPEETPAAASVEGTPALEESRRVSPDLLQRSVGWEALGGGVEECPTEVAAPEMSLTTSGNDALADDSNALTIGGRAYLVGCGFPPLETATATFYLPDGRVESGPVQIDEAGSWSVTWWSLPDEPLGVYRFEFAASVGAFATEFTVYEATQPAITYECGPEQSLVLLAGFADGEEVLLARYVNAPGDNLLDYEYVTVRSDGTALLTLPLDSALLVVVGQEAQPVQWVDVYGKEVAFVASDYVYLIC
jgi:hypothetical protein